MTRMPSDDELRFAADMMLADAEGELTECEFANDADEMNTRCDAMIAAFFLKNYGKPAPLRGSLLVEMRETADWLEERAKVLQNMADALPVKGPASPNVGLRQQLRDEAARFEGRAAVIRQTILKATQGA